MAYKNETVINNFKINCLSEELYKEALRNNEVNENELYMVSTNDTSVPKVEWDDILNKPSAMPASDVYPWAKQSTKPTYTKEEIGLENVDNTADSVKSVNYATTSGTASRLGTNTEGSSVNPIYLQNGYPSACTYTLEKSVPSNAVFTDTTYTDMVGAGTYYSGQSGLVPAPTAGNADRYLCSDGTWKTVSASGSVDSLSDLGVTASATELNYVDGVTSNIQSQLDSKASYPHGHTANSITMNDGDNVEGKFNKLNNIIGTLSNLTTSIKTNIVAAINSLKDDLKNVVTKNMISSQHVNDTQKVPTSALVYGMQQSITNLNNMHKKSYQAATGNDFYTGDIMFYVLGDFGVMVYNKDATFKSAADYNVPLMKYTSIGYIPSSIPYPKLPAYATMITNDGKIVGTMRLTTNGYIQIYRTDTLNNMSPCITTFYCNI